MANFVPTSDNTDNLGSASKKWAKLFTQNITLGNNLDLMGSAIVAKSFGENGYIKYASGLIIQWGHEPSTSFVDSATGKYINYPISFSSYSTSNVVASIDKETPTIMEASVSKGKEGFTLYRSQQCAINWLAIGY